MKHALALGVVVLVALGTVVATVAVGSSVREPTVVANPYEAGLHHAATLEAKRNEVAAAPKVPGPPGTEIACDFDKAPCAATAGSFEVRLELGPRPLETMTDLAATVTITRAGAPVDGLDVGLAFEMRGMSMGQNQRVLKGEGKGRYSGKATLVRCPSGRKDWLATVTAPVADASVVARFALRVAK